METAGERTFQEEGMGGKARGEKGICWGSGSRVRQSLCREENGVAARWDRQSLQDFSRL